MPIYEYSCTDCSHDLEVLQKMSDMPLEQCPACGKNTLKKRISAAAFHLKGTGWYETDFKGSSKKPEEKTENKTEKKTEKKTENKTEKKTEKKTETSTPASTC